MTDKENNKENTIENAIESKIENKIERNIEKNDRIPYESDILEKFHTIIQALMNEIITLYHGFIEQPGEPEAAHKLRVKIRQLRSLLSFMKPLLEKKEYTEIQNQLKKLALCFAHLRELDVLLEDWKKVEKTYPEATDSRHLLERRLEKMRQKEQKKLCKNSMKQNMGNGIFLLSQKFKEELKPEQGKFLTKTGQNLSYKKYITIHFRKWMKKAEESRQQMNNLESPLIKQRDAVHGVRIRYKKLRYMEEILKTDLIKNPESLKKSEKTTKLLTDDTGSILNLKSIQDGLGIICDLPNNLKILKKIMKTNDNSQLIYECGLLSGHQIMEAELCRNQIFQEIKTVENSDK